MTTLQEAVKKFIEATKLDRIEFEDWPRDSQTAFESLRTALAQQGKQQPVAWYEYNQDLNAWFLAYGHNPKAKTRPLVFGDTAAPAPQAQDKSDNYLSGYCTGRTDLLKEQSAQLVTQPLAKTCDTCAHYQQGKHPGVSIHDETCYECRSYWGNKWEAA